MSQRDDDDNNNCHNNNCNNNNHNTKYDDCNTLPLAASMANQDGFLHAIMHASVWNEEVGSHYNTHQMAVQV